jgi:F-type H+-transporting ATPase subunit epsilon
MPAPFHLSVVAPDRSVVDTQVTSVIAPGVNGYFGLWANHVPMVAALRTGLLEYEDTDLQRIHIAIGGGFLEVSENKVTVLADSAERAEEIDLAKAEEELEEARKALRGESGTMTSDEAAVAVERALNRIQAARGRR